MNLSPKRLIKFLEDNGFIFKRAKGSHQLYHNPVTNKTVIVPVHGGKDMKKGTFLAIIKQAGLDKNDLD
ncbi:MAG TPA: type II toxin-antitoxin system HicA family toxin [Chitinophagaceae bacterium]|jgi:predicted RNA binding protein YcfA (HicA-like mRNA interferase family)|nr:type II toxin-antitoxin system HicA family toxin [Chitinophagaceae bacterium]HNA91377.1 type II toxin-antitoxin system HicA family toxin [Chitinophagaceae bacterium]HNJ25932.1 type II toxin-antitoxin system HicA family toxin [Chitinophagaceae bacterium]HNJ57106.1 type II toxin-antitoxin system HicA family toxin [Chitinophagaceae bacterium]HNK62004.1 type II toxin-antitoxin system HicA family toxin [Chitinophagaceae bacterium]